MKSEYNYYIKVIHIAVDGEQFNLEPSRVADPPFECRIVNVINAYQPDSAHWELTVLVEESR